ncbi:MAG TPA: hypothetical protein VK524_16755, partial [Polyangiaceae bacterium]|nr:hypothetical protein [Polyangiaceae bacterium]
MQPQQHTHVCTAYCRIILASISVFLLTACDPKGTFSVNTTEDAASGSLRDAITRANASTEAAVRIELPNGTYQLTRCGVDDTNVGGDLDATTRASITLVGTGPSVVIRQMCPGERVLDARGEGRLVLNGVTITGGSVASADPALPADGGGVRARGDVKLENATITQNTATGAGARSAIFGGTPTAGGAARGAGLYVGGSLDAVNSTLSLNAASGGAGADAPTPDGVAAAGGPAEGGGAYVLGAVSVSGGSLTQNRAAGGNGGYSLAAAAGGGSARGGGIAQRATTQLPLTLTATTLTGNSAQGGGANGGENLNALDPAGDATGGAIAAGGSLTGTSVTATQNTAQGGSTRTGCPPDVVCNSFAPAGAGRGGALAIAGLLTLQTSSFSSNRAASGDAFFTCRGWSCAWVGVPASPGIGGGVLSGAHLTLTEVTFSKNIAEEGLGLPTAEGLG